MHICPREDRIIDIKSTTSMAGRVTSMGKSIYGLLVSMACYYQSRTCLYISGETTLLLRYLTMAQ